MMLRIVPPNGGADPTPATNFYPGPNDELVGGLGEGDDPYCLVAVECPSIGVATVALAFYDAPPFAQPDVMDLPVYVSRMDPEQARRLAATLIEAVDYAAEAWPAP
jgi:hypothetical protein